MFQGSRISRRKTPTPTRNPFEESFSVRSALTASLALLLALAACSTPARQTRIDSPDPQARLRAVQLAAEAEDRESLKTLIRALESDDAAVRVLSINALERRTGERFDYDHAAPIPERKASIDRWVNWYAPESGTRTPQSGGNGRSSGQ